MSAPAEMIETGALAIYRQFIRSGVGTCRMKPGGVPETIDEAVERRWQMMPELSRQRFRDEAAAVLEVV